jgi:hypothetical protein
MMMATVRKIGLAAAAAVAFAALSTVPASARWHGHHGWHHRHHGAVFSFSFGTPYRAYAYRPYCHVRRVVHYNRHGRRVVRVRRVCY